MFNCFTHGWSSLYSQCPSCFTIETSTTIGGSGTPVIVKNPEQDYELLSINPHGEILIRCPDCQRKGEVKWDE